MINQYRIKIENEFDFKFIKKFLIDNGIGGQYACVGIYLPDGKDFASIEYNEDYKEISLETYPQEQVDIYLKNDIISPLLWNEKNEAIFINRDCELENSDVNENIKPISVTEFLTIKNK
jgi:hypothetical protein